MFLFALQRIAADQLAEGIRFVGGAAPAGPHLIQFDTHAGFGRLESSFAAGQAGANHSNNIQTSV